MKLLQPIRVEDGVTHHIAKSPASPLPQIVSILVAYLSDRADALATLETVIPGFRLTASVGPQSRIRNSLLFLRPKISLYQSFSSSDFRIPQFKASFPGIRVFSYYFRNRRSKPYQLTTVFLLLIGSGRAPDTKVRGSLVTVLVPESVALRSTQGTDMSIAT